MFAEDATASDLSDTAEDFTWLFDYVKTNASSSARFKTGSCNTVGEYKITFLLNGLRAVIATWLDNDCIDPVEQMNETALREYNKLFAN